MTEIRVPTLGESVTEATVGQWFKKPGDAVAADEPLVELETDKVTLEVPAPAAGVLAEIAVKDGETVGSARCSARSGRRRRGSAGRPGHQAGRQRDRRARRADRKDQADRRRARQPARVRPAAPAIDMPRRPPCASSRPKAASIRPRSTGTGKRGQVIKGDMLAAIERARRAADAGRGARAGADARARRRPTTRRARSACA